MKEELISLLESFGYPVILQGSLGPSQEYPESFFTFWNSDSYDGSHYNNIAIKYIWDFDINFYSVDPTLVNTLLLQAIELLKNNGWIMSGRGYDVPSDESTHTGRGINVLKIERN